jgi:hypothetical protein
MTTVLPELSDDLAAAAERLAVTAPSTTRGRRGRRARFVALCTAAIVGVGGVATAATGLWNPQIGDGSDAPSVARDAPPQAQLDALGVLRRPQTDADRGENSEYTLKFFGSLRGVRLAYVRLLGTEAGGAGYVLVPAASEGTDGVPARLRALKAQHDAGAGGVPPKDSLSATKDPLCLFARDPSGSGGGVNCFSLQQVLDGRATMGRSPAHGPLTQFGLVADNVAQVRAGNGPTAPVVDVRDNFFEITTPIAEDSEPTALHFLDGDGREIRRTLG